MLAIVAWSPKAYSVGGAPDGVRGDLALPFILPGGALMLNAMLGRPLVEWTSAIVPAVVALCLLMAGHRVATREQRPRLRDRLMIAGLAMMWAIGAVTLANANLDRGKPWAFHHVRVRGKHVSHGKVTTWYVAVDPWGPRRKPADVMVARSVYEAVTAGGTVCIGLRPGGLGMPWYWVFGARCPEAPQRSCAH